MQRLKIFIIALVADLVVLFNLKRVTLQDSQMDALPVVYAVAFLSIVAIVALKPLRRMNIFLSLVLWNGLNWTLRLATLPERPLLGGLFTYETIAEATLLSITVLLAHQVARALNDFERAVEDMTLTSMGRKIRPLEESSDDVETEMIRSRRYHHPLSLILVESDASATHANLAPMVQEMQSHMLMRYASVLLGRTISGILRRTDSIFEQTLNGRYVILCPETNNEESQELVERIQNLCREKFGIPVRCAASSFPDQALTLDDLMREAEARLGTGTLYKIPFDQLRRDAGDGAALRTPR